MDVTAWLALVLSVVSLIWQWNDRRRRLVVERPRLTAISIPQNMGLKSVPVLSVHIFNPGANPIYVKEIWLDADKPHRGEFQLPSYDGLYNQLPIVPFTVEPHRDHTFLAQGQRLAEALQSQGYTAEIEAHIKVCDETATQYRSKPARFSIAHLKETTMHNPTDKPAGAVYDTET